MHLVTRRAVPLSVAVATIAAALVASAPAGAIDVSAQAAATPVEVMPADPLAAFDDPKGDPLPVSSIVPVEGHPEFTQALEISVSGPPQSPGLDGEYEIAIAAGTGAAVQQGDAMLATFWARSIDPLESGASSATFTFERAGVTFRKSANATLRIPTEWTRFEFPFEMVEGYPADGAQISLWLGYGAQTFQVAGVSVLDYGQDPPADYPTVTYAGREASAPWRSAAAERIDQNRKGDLEVAVVDTAGNPVPGAQVKVDMLEHAFTFGSAANGAHLVADDAMGSKYREIYDADFNQGVLGNDLKWRYWEDESHRESITLPALARMHEQDKRVRGHTLVWGSWGNMPADVQELQDDPAALRARIDAHVTDEATALAGQIDIWDVVNEPYSEHNVTDILGPAEIGRWFELAKQADPDAVLALNDYGILTHNGWNTRHQDHFYDTAAALLDAGAPVESLGFQGHFTGLQPTPPADLLPIFDRYAGLGLPLEITEFDIVTPDEQLQADYTRDFLTMAFSYPQIGAISTFGFWESNIWNPLAALYRTDWTAKPNAQVWRDLIYRQWWTKTQGETAADGSYTTRGFLGDYLVTVTAGGVSKQQRVSMPTTDGATLTVVADGIQVLQRTDPDDAVLAGGFEHGTDAWTRIGARAAEGVADPHSGTTALRTAPGSGVSQPVVDVAPGSSQTLTAWGKSAAAGTQCFVGVRGGPTPGGLSFQHTLTYDNETAYTQKLAAFTVPAGSTWTQVFVWQNDAGASAGCTIDDVALTPSVGTAPPPPLPPAVGPELSAEPSFAVNGDIESGATNGWYCLGTCTSLTATTTTPHSGEHALVAAGRAEAWVGPVQGVRVADGGRYDSAMWVRLGAAGSDTARVQLKVTTSTGSVTIPMGSATITGDAWTRIAAENVLVDVTGTIQKAEWWVSTTTSTADLLVDDASLAVHMSGPPGLDLLVNGDVEKGGSNWYCFSPCAASAVTTPVHGGAQALRAAGRTYEWAGPAQGVQLANGGHYTTSAWIRLADGSAPSTALIKAKLWFTDGTSQTVPLAQGAVSAGAWTQVTAADVPVTWTKPLERAEWFVSTTAGAGDLYLDDAVLRPVGTFETTVAKLVPTAACTVANPDGSATAYFGYSNPNAFGLPVPVGAANLVTTGEPDQGQPVSFLPFQRPRRFAVEFDPAQPGSSVSWRLNGVTQTADATTPACT